MVLDDVIKKVTKKLEEDRSIGGGFGMFERKNILSKKLVRYMADEGFFATEVVTKFLNNNSKPHYHFQSNQINSYRKAKEKGVNISDIQKYDILGIIRIYYTENAVKALLKHCHKRNWVDNHNKKDILKNLKEVASQL
nr:hypothetical protein [Nanoarchaeota archaeon]